MARTYFLSPPANYDPNTPYELIIAFHGLGNTGSGFRDYLAMESVAAGKAIFAYPDGLPVPEGSSGWDLTANGRDIALLDAMIDQLSATYCINPGAVFVIGFSYGGWMANTAACVRGNRLHGFAAIAGGGPSGRCVGPLGAMIIHGTDDGSEPVTSGQHSRDLWRQTNGCGTQTQAVDPSPCVAYQGCTAGDPLVYCEHSGLGGHVVPDFARAGIWNFFQGQL